jgi:GNAT superfamily N-acetyltransferase
MSQITVRQATLADAASITALHNATITTWTRRLPSDEMAPAEYDELTLYERWLNGGPWASVEMCAVHLANLLRGSDGIPLVAEIDGHIGAEAEIFIGREPEPFGYHLNIAKLTVHPNWADSGVSSALLTYIRQMGEAIRCKRLTVADGEGQGQLFEHHQFSRTHNGQQIILAAREGRVFYQASDLRTFDPQLIEGWHMPLGRYQNARQEWDRLPPGFWNSVPEIVEIETARLHVLVTGHEAYALMQQDRDIPTRVHAFVWSKRPVKGLLVMTLCDWAQRHSYSEIISFAWDFTLPLLEMDFERAGAMQHLYSRML